jgi:hypothetical protein
MAQFTLQSLRTTMLSRHCPTGKSPDRIAAILVLALVGILFCIGRIS